MSIKTTYMRGGLRIFMLDDKKFAVVGDNRIVPFDEIKTPVKKRIYSITFRLCDIEEGVPVYDFSSPLFDVFETKDFIHFERARGISRPMIPSSMKGTYAVDDPYIILNILSYVLEKKGYKLSFETIKTNPEIILYAYKPEKGSHYIDVYVYTIESSQAVEPEDMKPNFEFVEHVENMRVGEEFHVSERTVVRKNPTRIIELADGLTIVDENRMILSNGYRLSMSDVLRNNVTRITDDFVPFEDFVKKCSSKLRMATTYDDPVALIKRLYDAPLFIGPLVAKVSRYKIVTQNGELIIKKKNLTQVPEWVWNWVRYLFGMENTSEQVEEGEEETANALKVRVTLAGKESSVTAIDGVERMIMRAGKTYFVYDSRSRKWTTNTNIVVYRRLKAENMGYAGDKFKIAWSCNSLHQSTYIPRGVKRKIENGEPVSWVDYFPGLNEGALKRKGGEHFIRSMLRTVKWSYEYFDVRVVYYDGVLNLRVPYDNTVDVYSPVSMNDVPDEYVVSRCPVLNVHEWPEKVRLSWYQDAHAYGKNASGTTIIKWYLSDKCSFTMDVNCMNNRGQVENVFVNGYILGAEERMALLTCRTYDELLRLLSLM